MDLKTFVAETLQQIIAGIKEAQATEGGTAINAQMYGAVSGQLMSGGGLGIFTRVDFDVAISAETSGGAKGAA